MIWWKFVSSVRYYVSVCVGWYKSNINQPLEAISGEKKNSFSLVVNEVDAVGSSVVASSNISIAARHDDDEISHQ